MRFVEPEATVIELSNDEEEVISIEEPDCQHQRDPRTWSSRKKACIFIALMSSSILADGYAHVVIKSIRIS